MPLPVQHNHVCFMQDEMIAETTKVKKGGFSAAAGFAWDHRSKISKEESL